MTESIEKIHVRAEDRLACPRCGQHGHLKRIGGGKLASRFKCEASAYPRRYCGFRFVVSDRMLAAAVSR